MQDIAIRVENVNKVFRIYDHPSDRLKEAFSFKREKFHTDFPALKNISFEVKRGEFLGIVGRNGAGKSTLLRILSRELTPSSGKVSINGKVSLLQLGVGFDVELTGVENAKFASKLLGYNDDQIEAMMEDIIAFADIGEFIHHPVKTYSSGMYSRLSFAVGININPDILIADEVLSVGDMRFSQKCLRKMRDFKDQGKTIIFVSHDTQSVNVFCDTAMWIKEGALYLLGESKMVTTSFQNYMLYDKLPNEYVDIPLNEAVKIDEALIADDQNPEVAESYEPLPSKSIRDPVWISLRELPCVGDGRAEIKRIAFFVASTGKAVTTVAGNEEVILLLDIQAKADIDQPQVGIVLYNRQGLPALHTNNDICGFPVPKMYRNQEFVAEFKFTLPSLANGDYIFTVGLQSGSEMPHKIEDAYQFNVSRGGPKGTQCGYVIIETEKFRLLGKSEASRHD